MVTNADTSNSLLHYSILLVTANFNLVSRRNFSNAEHDVFSDTVRKETRKQCPVFGRPYYRSSLWYSVSSVVCLSSVCNVLYCGKTVRPSETVSEGVNRKPGSKSSFLGSRHISTSGFAATATETAVLNVFALFLLV